MHTIAIDMKRKPINLDNASTTPLHKEVLKAMMPFFSEKYGNPSNLYELGRISRSAINESLARISGIIHSRPDEFVFTGGATEADNLAIAGIARANKEFGNRIIISSVEHKGIFSVCEALKKEGFEIVEIPVDKNGLLKIPYLEKALNEKTLLVSVTMADSETGTIQPIREISEIIKRQKAKTAGADANARAGHLPYFHTDASQASAYLDINVENLGVDLMTLSAHKIGGPKGIGGLYIKRGTKINPIIYGGSQQNRVRAGTENVPSIVGFARALEISEKNKGKGKSGKKSKIEEIRKLRDLLEKNIFKNIQKVVLNGHPEKRLPNFLNVSILDIEGEALLLHLDAHGIMISTGSACNSESLEPSSVLSAIGNPYEFVHSSMRFTLSSETTKSDIEYVLKHLPKIVETLRHISPLNLKVDQKEKMSDPRAFVGGKTPHFLRKKRNA
ncbi:MAG: aminotransferase class V-fold PLP-dependent enzyme [Candidatus Taylorbacteria bacterium]|nr:aminotransferase class V-fold PLP-dependent enzyme [Candidatus Taylorbacteria bacterium]